MERSVSAHDRGFTLIEVLVALAIFSLAALALVKLDSATIRTGEAIERRQIARIVLNNLAVEALTDPVPPALGQSEGDLSNGGRSWHWRRTVGRADGIVRIDLGVADQAGQILVRQTIVRPSL
jgi:general secretion pathway protein I